MEQRLDSHYLFNHWIVRLGIFGLYTYILAIGILNCYYYNKIRMSRGYRLVLITRNEALMQFLFNVLLSIIAGGLMVYQGVMIFMYSSLRPVEPPPIYFQPLSRKKKLEN